jgi:hypothetical protein
MLDTKIKMLPADVLSAIPPNEKILWVDNPDWKFLAWHAFGVKLVFIYFLVVTFYKLVLYDISSLNILIGVVGPYLISSFIATLLLLTLAFFQSKNINYVITENRILIKNGTALVFLLNAPLKRISSIDRQLLWFGFGNISFTTDAKKRIPFLSCWPSVRPWSLGNPKPSFRCISNISEVESLLSDATKKDIELNTKTPDSKRESIAI